MAHYLKSCFYIFFIFFMIIGVFFYYLLHETKYHSYYNITSINVLDISNTGTLSIYFEHDFKVDSSNTYQGFRRPAGLSGCKDQLEYLEIYAFKKGKKQRLNNIFLYEAYTNHIHSLVTFDKFISYYNSSDGKTFRKYHIDLDNLLHKQDLSLILSSDSILMKVKFKNKQEWTKKSVVNSSD